MTTVTRTAGAAGSISIATKNSAGQLITPVSTPTVTWYTDSGRSAGAVTLPVTGSAGNYTATWTGAQAPASQAMRYLKVGIETATGVFSYDVDDDISFLAAGSTIATTDYTNLPAVKSDLGITDTADDIAIASSITAASRHIDRVTGTTFYPVTEARTFSAPGGGCVMVDRFTDPSSLVLKTGTRGTYPTTIAAGNYVLWPYNAPSRGQAYYRIDIPYGYTSVFWDGFPNIEVTASWGWHFVPDDVERACRLIAVQLFRRRDTPEGTGGTSEYGIVQLGASMDPQAMTLLRNGGYIDMGIA